MDAGKTARQLRELIGTLLLQFVLGALLTTVLDYDPNHMTVSQIIFVVLHVSLAIYILIIAGLRLYKANKTKALLTESWTGLGSVIVAFAAGSMAVQNGSTWATFVMALGFVGAIGAYIIALTRVKA